jgi:hypothetical protein
MKTLIATKEKDSWNRYKTVLHTTDGKVKAIFPSNLNQPRRGLKTIVVNCFRWSLVWAEKE